MMHLKTWRRATERGQEQPLPLHLQVVAKQTYVRPSYTKGLVSTTKWMIKFKDEMKEGDYLRGKHLMTRRYPGMYACEIPSLKWIKYTHDLSKAMGWKQAAYDMIKLPVLVYQVGNEETNDAK